MHAATLILKCQTLGESVRFSVRVMVFTVLLDIKMIVEEGAMIIQMHLIKWTAIIIPLIETITVNVVAQY